MCGRYMITSPVEAIREAFGVEDRPNLGPRYNVAPTQSVPIVRARAPGEEGAAGRELVLVRWGLVPFWAKDLKFGYRTINARAETVATAPAFRDAFRRRRCLVVADGFYEWQKRNGGKQPYLVRVRGSGPFAFAGLWESWTDKASGERTESCTIIVTRANALVAPIHDRMPVILAPADYAAWLDPAAADGRTLLRPYPAESMEAWPVSPRVGNVKNDDAELAEPVAVQSALDLTSR